MTIIKTTIASVFLFMGLLACQADKKQQQNKVITELNQNKSKSIALSKQLITHVMAAEPTSETEEKLQKLDFDRILTELNTDLKKKVFWINIYNAYIQLILQEDDASYEDKSSFFSKKQILIARVKFSFDDIEHGIIRGTKFKYGLGYVDNPFSDEKIKKLQCDEIDERIHFALNCGAVSCPPVKTYTLENFETEMDASTKSFLKTETTFLEVENKVITTRLFQWYQGDFELNVVDYLKKYDVIPQWVEPKVEYSEYNWEKRLIRN
ncbi:MAG: DUF547 domain-containing protein [Vicingaceae bacterium]